MQRNGRVNSGDVSIFYRAFGTRGGTPILLMHGANYFDSYDWIEGRGSARHRPRGRQLRQARLRRIRLELEQGLFRRRQYGRHSRGHRPSLKWDRPIVVGHSASGRLSISFAANFPEKISRLVVVDSGMARDEGGGVVRRSAIRRWCSNRSRQPWRISPSCPTRRASRTIARAREAALVKVEKGYMLKRDPDFQNTRPQDEGASLPQRASRDVWQDLAAVKCPTLMVRGLRSDRYTPGNPGAHRPRLSEHRMGDRQLPA